ncbi:hypothetical protein [Alienimonas sp. DA493]|uniref:hypothetical protein n=1 Tax=Alienimonas sp. DA493 TaxID=3373605 RepID=UPI00375456EB
MKTLPIVVRRLWLTRLTGAATLVLISVTWPLWLPPTPTSFPQLPLFAWLIPAPAWCDWIALAGIVVGAVGMAVSRESEAQARGDAAAPRLRFGLTWALALAPALFTLSLAFALALNQIRIQVWAYQFLLLGAVLSLCPQSETGDRAAVTLGRVLAVGVLFHSGLSKLDLAFAEGPGSWLMGGFLSLFGVEANGLDEKAVSAIAFAVPAWEIALSVLLAVPSLRRVGLIAAVFMHTSVVATLWKLDQSWGVLLWNAFFLAHEFLLFWPAPKSEGVPLWTTLRTAGPRALPAGLLIAAAVLLPFGTRSGYWDVWPGWAVYAGGVPKARVIRPMTLAEIRRYDPDGTWPFGHDMPEDYDRRGLERLGAPVPQDPRVRVGLVVADVLRGRVRHPSLTVLSPGARWETDSGTAAGYQGDERVRRFADDFLLNARPRALSLPAEAP